MLPILPTLFALFRSPLAIGIGVVALVAFSVWGAYWVVDSRGFARAERACAVELQASQSQRLHDLFAAQEGAHQFYLAEVERGDAISAELAKTQRRLDATKTEYLAYANAITGHCPGDLGVLMSWPARESDREAGENPTPGSPPHSADTVDAAAIAQNIAINRWACESNYAIHSALTKWHKGDLNGQ